MLPKAAGKIFLTITLMRMYFLLCLFGRENSESQVKCALLTQSNVMGTPKLGQTFSSLLFYINPPMDPLN